MTAFDFGPPLQTSRRRSNLQTSESGLDKSRSSALQVALTLFRCSRSTLQVELPDMPRQTVKMPPVRKLPHTSHRVGGWLPLSPATITAHIAKLQAKVDKSDGTLLPVVQALQDLIEFDPDLYAGANLMISQVPTKYKNDPAGNPQMKSYQQMCQLINAAISGPPEFNESEVVGFPINAILDWSMGTPAGTHFFLNEKVNEAFKAILNYWGQYLSSSASLLAFKDPSEGGGGWMTPAAEEKLDMSMYVQPDPNALAWGYESWNAWFIREFVPGLRPVADPGDDAVIVSACESTPFSLRTDVQLRSTFWAKGQPYSLQFMLNNDPLAEAFVGGIVYQAFLSAFNYHRWRSPVNGKILKTAVVPGSYYAEALSEGFDEGGPNLSQGYITNYAARGIIYIEATDPTIGLMAVVTVGMSEVSSNIITVSAGQPVCKGDELGYFQFGGSTHCLLFRKGVISEWSADAIPEPNAELVPVSS